MKATIKNISSAPQGVHCTNGVVTIEPGETRTLNVLNSYSGRLQSLTSLFEVTDIEEGDDGEAGSSGGPSAIALRAAEIDQHMREAIESRDRRIAELEQIVADLRQGGSDNGGAPQELDRDELKRQAAELGIDFPRNASDEKLKELIDAKLAS